MLLYLTFIETSSSTPRESLGLTSNSILSWLVRLCTVEIATKVLILLAVATNWVLVDSKE